MEKIKIKKTGKTYELGNREEVVEARCSSLCGYITTNNDYKLAINAIEKYREGSDDFFIGQDNGWVLAGTFKKGFGEAIEDMEKRYGDLTEYVQELIDKYDESTLLTGLDGCFYCTDSDSLYEDALDPKALGCYWVNDDNIFYFVIPEQRFYLPEQIEFFYE